MGCFDLVVYDESVSADALLGHVHGRGAVEEVIEKTAVEADAVSVPCLDFGPDEEVFVFRIRVVDVEADELGQAVDVGLGARFPTAPRTIAEDDDWNHDFIER